MPIYKNVASQKVFVMAYNSQTGELKTGDAANISCEISKDGGTSAATNDVAPTEIDAVDHPGIYAFDMTAAETNCNHMMMTPVSSTSNIILDQVSIYTFDMSLINTEIVDVLKTDTIADLTQQAPPATPTFEEAVMYLYSALRNKAVADKTGNVVEYYNDSGTLIWKKNVTKTATDFTEAEGITGA